MAAIVGSGDHLNVGSQASSQAGLTGVDKICGLQIIHN